MAGPYRHQPQGLDALVARIKKLEATANNAAGAAIIRNSAISGGTGLSVVDPDGQRIRLYITPEEVSSLAFTPPTANQVSDWEASIGFDPDGSFGGGSLSLTSPASPSGGFAGQPPQTASITVASGDGGPTGQSSIWLNADSATGVANSTIQLGVLAGAFGNQANIALGGGGRIEDDGFSGQSWRLFAGIASLVFPFATAELRCRDAGNANYVPIRASAFTVTSTREAKQDITDLDWSAADVVTAAKAQRYRYKPEHADPDRIHFGPMADDLPAELIDNTDPEAPALNLADLVGVLWAAVGELNAEVKSLRAQIG